MTKINIEREEFIRVGTTLYKLVNQPRLNGGYVKKRIPWNAETLRQDYGKGFMATVPKYDGFCTVPSHVSYKPVVDKFLNLYEPIEHQPVQGDFPHIRPTSFSFRQQPSEPSFQQLEVRELTHPALLRYLQERGIDRDVAKSECKELHFNHNGKPYFAIGFGNVAGGYEVRNPFFKGCISPKDISHIQHHGERRDSCYLFEGFMDYLSFLTIRKRKNPQSPGLKGQDYMVLNSVSNLGKAIDRLSDYERIHCFFDNDQAGNKACLELERVFSYRVRDASLHYSGYKDLNDFLCGKKVVENKKEEVSVKPKPNMKGFVI